MKNKLIAIALFAMSACNSPSKWQNGEVVVEESPKILNGYGKKIVNYQDSISAIFLSGSNGVLSKKDVSALGHLHFYEPNEAYQIPAVFTKTEDGKVFQMKTNTDRLPEYRTYGSLRFEIDGVAHSLTLYQSVEMPDYLFCPFKDLTNGNETYGGGRYLDFKLADLKEPIIDFNYCYNPYCAYNSEYSCPIPPYENHLKVNIPAGEKKWH
jgi:uncharacterized protein (DUF1684 family)